MKTPLTGKVVSGQQFVEWFRDGSLEQAHIDNKAKGIFYLRISLLEQGEDRNHFGYVNLDGRFPAMYESRDEVLDLINQSFMQYA